MSRIAKSLLGPNDSLVRVKSWIPSIGRYGLEWPTMLINTKGGGRMTVTPIWDRAQFRELWNRMSKPKDSG